MFTLLRILMAIFWETPNKGCWWLTQVCLWSGSLISISYASQCRYIAPLKKKLYIMKEEQLLLTLSNLMIQLPILPTGSKKYTHGHIFLSMSIPAALWGVDCRRVWGVHFSNIYPDFINPNLPTDQYVLHVDIPNPQKVWHTCCSDALD